MTGEINTQKIQGIINYGDIVEKNYNNLSNKPQINGITLQGNLTSEELNIFEYKQLNAVYEGGKWVIKDGTTVLTFNDIVELYNDPHIFVYCIAMNVVHIPAFNETNAFCFMGEYYISEQWHLSRVIINSSNDVLINDVQVEEVDNKVDDLSEWETTEDDKYYPNANSVVNLVATKQDVITDLDAIRSGASQGATAEAGVEAINEKIPTQATSTNQLADKDFVNSSINSITAFYITKDAQGDQFATYAELASATVFYSGGEVRVPTRNDYCIVQVDENHDNSTTRYIYQNSQWEFQYVVNETALTSDQIKAINSGITDTLVTKLNGIEEGAQKNPDLTDYVKFTDYATSSKAGVFIAPWSNCIYMTGANLSARSITYKEYQSMGDAIFIGKATLENVITGKDLTTKAYVDGLVGDINTVLTTLTTGSGV